MGRDPGKPDSRRFWKVQNVGSEKGKVQKVKEPSIHSSCFIAPNATVIGDVEVGEGSSVWFGAVIRGDVNSIRIGKKSNIQDLSIVHVTNQDAPKPASTTIGDEVTIGHRVIIHGAAVGNRCLVGMGAILLDHVVVEDECVIGAASLVTEGTRIAAGHLAFGSPAKVVRELTVEERAWLKLSADHYANLAQKYKNG